MLRRATAFTLLAAAGLGGSLLRAEPTTAAGNTAAVRGPDTAGMDQKAVPGDDFYAFANGTWLKSVEIPADKAVWSSGAEITEKTTGQVRELLEKASNAPDGTIDRKVGDVYATYMDEAAIEAQGAKPVQANIARALAVKDKKDLARVLGEELRADVDALNSTDFHTERLFGLWVTPDLNNPDRYVPYLLQGGLGMPDREYYVNPSARMADLRAKYKDHVAATFKLTGVDDAAARAERVLALEIKMATAHASRETSMDVLKANNPWKRAEFATRAPGLDWAVFFKAASLDRAPVVIVWHPDATKGLAALVGSEPIEAWRDWLAFHAVDHVADLLPKAFVDEKFAFYGKALSGTPQLGDRWKRGVAVTSATIGYGVGQIYVKRYFPPESKAKVQEMVRNIVDAFSRRIDRLDWMAPATKAQAKQKLATLHVGVGYPDKWTDYGPLKIVRGDAVGNAERAELFETRRSLAKLGKKVDRTEWCMWPHLVNAVNLPIQNAMNFPAAILQPPYFDPAATAAVNYASIGSVIGHEISHSFDDQGAQFDSKGRLHDWWTAEDRAHFEKSGQELVDQFNQYKPFPDLAVNGKLTLSENLADLAGLAAAHDAWQASLGGKPAPQVAGLDGEQQFYVAFAQVWRGKAREAALRQRLITDGHSPGMYRALTVRNLDPWYTAFGVKEGQKLYLPPAERVRVW